MRNNTKRIPPQLPVVVGVAALGFLLFVPDTAQAQGTVLFACYVPNSGVVYRVNPPGSPGQSADLKDACITEDEDEDEDEEDDETKHVLFSWNAEGPAGPPGPEGPAGGGGNVTFAVIEGSGDTWNLVENQLGIFETLYDVGLGALILTSTRDFERCALVGTPFRVSEDQSVTLDIEPEAVRADGMIVYFTTHRISDPAVLPGVFGQVRISIIAACP